MYRNSLLWVLGYYFTYFGGFRYVHLALNPKPFPRLQLPHQRQAFVIPKALYHPSPPPQPSTKRCQSTETQQKPSRPHDVKTPNPKMIHARTYCSIQEPSPNCEKDPKRDDLKRTTQSHVLSALQLLLHVRIPVEAVGVASGLRRGNPKP